jgi:uncharacterized protein (TIGR03435 family)
MLAPCVALFFCLCELIAIDSQQSTATFEVASIKPSNADPHSSSGIKTGHGRLEARNVTLKRCIMSAYGIGPHQIYGGPDWLNSDHYEISAKADHPTDDDAELMQMLQTLLAERFKLKVHEEKRILPAFVLEVKDGPKLQKAAGGESATNTSSNNNATSIDARNTTMDLFAKVLAREMDYPVIDQTGLQGPFNFKLHWTPDRRRPPDTGSAEDISIFTAIQEQLGLRLQSQKAPVDVLVIDHIERAPAEN